MSGYTKVPKKTLAKLLADLERSHVHAMNANTRALQYAGFATGTKARERAEFWQEKFDANLSEARAALDAMKVFCDRVDSVAKAAREYDDPHTYQVLTAITKPDRATITKATKL